MYKNQYYAGRLLLHEHPTQACSWEEECMQEVIRLPEVDYVDMHQCQLGQQDEFGNPVKKLTRWISNSKHILAALNKQCKGSKGWCLQGIEWKKHTPCYGKVATVTVIYPFQTLQGNFERLCEGDEGQRSLAQRG